MSATDFLEAITVERDQLTRWLERARDCAPAMESALQLLLQRLQAGGKIVLTGVGKSGKVAEKIAATLSSTGSLAIYLHPTDGLHGDLGLLREGDVVLALSYSGNTEELIRLLPSLQKRKIPLIALVGNLRSQLAQSAQVVLDGSVAQEACPLALAPTSSTTLALVLGDALAVSLMKRRGFDAEAFALNHPAGGIGKKLTLTVNEVMHPLSQVGKVTGDSTMDEVIRLATETKLGGVLVLENQKLLGLITDGDLRRALQHRERFFQLKASEVMTQAPTTVAVGAMADQALHLMENRPSQISVLPVVDEKNHCVGLIRLHDLVRTL